MARGTSQQAATDSATAATAGQNASQALGLAMPAIQGQMANPGFDATTANAIRRSGMDTTNTAFDAAKNSAAQRAGATGNDAMYYASANDLAQKRAAGLSNAATNAETTIGKQALTSQQQAIQDASQLYGTSVGQQTASQGQAGQMDAATPGFLNYMQGILGAAGSAAGGIGGLIKGINS